MYIKIEDLDLYKISMEVGEDIWLVVQHWHYMGRDTLGKQIIRSADSIALNIAEGHGRYHYKENRNFCYFARGSNVETKAALQKALSRHLITPETFSSIMHKLERIQMMLNRYIQTLGTNDLMTQ